MILGRYLLTNLGMDLKFSVYIIIGGEVPYKGCSAPMVELSNYEFKYITYITVKLEESFIKWYVDEEFKYDNAIKSTCRMRRILYMNHKKVELYEVTTKKCQKHLTATERHALLQLLKKFKDLFDGTLCTCNTTPVDLELKDDAKPVCLQPYPVPKVPKTMFKKEVKRIVSFLVLEEANNSEWGAPSFAQPKAKTNHIVLLSDLRNLNRQLKSKPYPMPKIRNMLFNLEEFQYAKSLYLNMSYYHIRLSEQVSNLCKIILPWEKHWQKRLTMGVRKSPDIFQKKINNIFRGFEFIRAYIDDLLIITKDDWYNHLENLELTLKKLKDNRLE